MGTRHLTFRPSGLTGTVLSIEQCPQPPGPGRLVLTTVNHLNRDVIERDLRDSDGRVETLRPTGNHKFYSVSRNEWLSASELREAARLNGAAGLVTIVAKRERLLGRDGPVTILSHEVHHRTTSVYNLEVHGEHVYQIGTLGVLVHNAGCDDAPKSVDNLVRNIGDDVTKWLGKDAKGYHQRVWGHAR